MSEPKLEIEHVEVEVESLGDGRWSRIERGLFTKLDQAPPPSARPGIGWRGMAFGAAAVAAAAAATVVFTRPGGGTGEPARIVTTASASRFTIGESSLLIAPSSTVLVRGDDDHGIDVVLDRGSVTCEVAPRHGRPPFVVDAGEVRVQVVGTRFTVARSDAETTVGVEHGVVQVSAAGKVTVLHDGDRWPVAEVAAPSVGTPGAPVAAPAMAPPPDPEPAVEPVPAMHAPVHVRPSAPPMTKTESAPAAAPPNASSPTSPPEAPAPSPQELFESAARIERSRPDDAAAIYRRLVVGGGDWSASSLFALGRLEADRGRKGEARRWLDQYLSRYPRGINADDARDLLRRMQ